MAVLPDWNANDDDSESDHVEWDEDAVVGGERFPVESHSSGDDGGDLSTADLEEAYLRALEAMESAEWAVPDEQSPPESAVITENEPVVAGTSERVGMVEATGVELAGVDFLGASAPVKQPVVESSIRTSTSTQTTPQLDASTKPLRVIEACLFVGGQPLSAKRLANLLDGNNEPSDLEVLIDELNQEYAAQCRPYEIRLGDGGYKLTLRAEFEPIRSRVYGVGPRDVKLSQDVLEVLALVAYQQPITPAEVEACKPHSANLLRQLLRRELISLTRIDQSRNGVQYHTTQRFLQLFGLGQLNELPRPEDLNVR